MRKERIRRRETDRIEWVSGWQMNKARCDLVTLYLKPQVRQVERAVALAALARHEFKQVRCTCEVGWVSVGWLTLWNKAGTHELLRAGTGTRVNEVLGSLFVFRDEADSANAVFVERR